MYENNLKLKYGEYEFCKSNPTFDELVNENFKFEKITGQDVKKDNDNLSIDIIFEKDINAGYVKKIIIIEISIIKPPFISYCIPTTFNNFFIFFQICIYIT